jgi:hypothetical protein
VHAEAHFLGGRVSTSPHDLGSLDDYVSGYLSDESALEFEEQLFEAAANGQSPELVYLDGLIRSADFVCRIGGFAGGATRAQVDAVMASGLPVHYFDLGAGGLVAVPLWPEGTKLVIFRLAVNVLGYENIDVDVSSFEGTKIKTFRDVQPAEDGSLYAVCEEPLARMSFQRGRVISRVMGEKKGVPGARVLIAEFDTSPG